MTINFYTNRSENRVVDKNIALAKTIIGTLKEDTDIVNPTILIEGNISEYATLNYVYIDEFQRFYYILAMNSVRYNLFEVALHTDVLMTYKATIRQQNALVLRQQNNYNNYLNDNRLRVNANPYVYQTIFPNGFTDDVSYVITLLGNSETETEYLNSLNIEEVETV